MREKRSWETLDFANSPLVIVGEGEGDARILSELAISSGLTNPNCIYTGQYGTRPDGSYQKGGNGHFGQLLAVLPRHAGFANIRDIVLAIDSTDGAKSVFSNVCSQIKNASGDAGLDTPLSFEPPQAMNKLSDAGAPRIHAMMIPGPGRNGGIETLCIEARVEKLEGKGPLLLAKIDAFVDEITSGQKWSTEKRDKLRLQILLSASNKERPEVKSWECFNTPQLISPKANAFAPIREFLQKVHAL